MLCLLLPLVVSVAAQGFGGAASEAPVPAGDCVIQDDEGVWRTCADAIARKAALRGDTEHARETVDEPAIAAPTAVVPEKPPEKKKTQLEIDTIKAGIDPTRPLPALRIREQELVEELEFLDSHGMPPHRKEPIEKELTAVRMLLADVEAMAITRMLACAKKNGDEIKLKKVRMTIAGPVQMTLGEIKAQLPVVDPVGCARIYLVDQESVDKVRRAQDLYVTLRTRSFTYYEIEERKRLEAEQKELDAFLQKEGIAPFKGRIRT